MQANRGALCGLLVLDLSRLLPGPYCTMILADHGARADRYHNLIVKKISKAVLARCEWGHDDYSLRVENLHKAPTPKGLMELFNEEPD